MTTATAHDPDVEDTLVMPSSDVAVPVPGDQGAAGSAFRWHRLRRLAGVIAFAAVLIGLALIRPVSLGGSFSFVIVAGESMMPTLAHGDLVITKRQDSYRRGDIVAYRIPEGDVGAGTLVIHRIEGGDSDQGYELRGDNRRRPDVWRPRASDVQGKVRAHVPGTGRLIVKLRTPLGIALACALVAFLVVSYPTRRE